MSLTDLSVKRQVLLERLKTSQVRKFTPTLTAIDKEIRERLTRGNLTQFSRTRLETQLAGLKDAIRGQYREYAAALREDLRLLAIDSAAYEARSLLTYAPGVDIATPAPAQLWSTVTTRPLTMTGANGGQLLESFMEAWAEGDAEMVANAVRAGYALGDTTDQIISRIRGTAALNYSDGVLAKSRTHAEAVTRTAIQHVANSARSAVWEQNSDIIDEYQWLSTLDSRTSPVCRDRDGQRFPIGRGPLPPAHPNCRSTTVAVLRGEFGRALDEELERASVDGPVDGRETYYDWLKRQDADFQDLALGPTRGKLFRDGGLSVEEFQRLQLGKNFEPLTLDQMRELQPAAFERAGLAPPAGAGPDAPPVAPSPPPFNPVSYDEARRLDASHGLTTPIPDDAKMAFGSYVGSGYRAMNEYLREASDVTDQIRHQVRQIADTLDASSINVDARLYRGLSANSLYTQMFEARGFTGQQMFDYEFNPKDLVGLVFEDPAFMSFSYEKAIADQFRDRVLDTGVTMRISARAGEKGWVSMAPITDYEREILRRGGRFRIVGWDPVEEVLDIEPLP